MLAVAVLFTFTSCKYDLKMNKQVTGDDLKWYREDVDSAIIDLLNTDFGYSFEVKQENKYLSDSAKNVYENNVKGFVNVENKLVESYRYKGKHVGTTYVYSIKGEEKTKSKITFEVVALNVSGELPTYYIEESIKGSGDGRSIKQKIKEKTRHGSISMPFELPSIDWIVEIVMEGLDDFEYVYVDDESFTAIDSDFDEQSTIVVLIDDGDLEAIKVVYESFYSSIEIEIEIKERDTIKKPSDAEKYKDKTDETVW